MAQPFTCLGIYKYRAPDTHCLLAPIIVEGFLEGLHSSKTFSNNRYDTKYMKELG